jgi:hypothetical protein
MATTKRTRPPKVTNKTEATAPEKAKVTTQAVSINEVIRTRAYELFEQRGKQHGRDFEDWLRAESEVRQRFGVPA